MTTPHDLTESTLSSQQLLDGNFLRVWRDQIRLPDGNTASREYLKHPGAVVVVPLLADDMAVTVNQYRYPLHRSFVEFPAGKLEADERGGEGAGAVPGAHAGVWACAVRELAEETGYRATHWAYAGAMHNAIAYCDEIIHIVFAKGLSAGERQLDVGEFMTVEPRSHATLQALVLNQALTDAKTCTALLWWQQLRSGAWQPQWHATAALPLHNPVPSQPGTLRI
jgi:ADP-ribose pyrophosphatase